jgi:hypothetical protein
MIVAWADEHFDATGRWPTFNSRRRIPATGGFLSSVYLALNRGLRGLPGGDSLTDLLRRHGRTVKAWGNREKGSRRAIGDRPMAFKAVDRLILKYNRHEVIVMREQDNLVHVLDQKTGHFSQ